MDLAAVVAAVLVGAVLLFAGVTKFVDQSAWRVDSTALGVPRVVAPVVPFVECAIGIGLFTGVARAVFALIAAGLIAAMTVVLVKQLTLENPPCCACFGRFSRKQIGVSDVSRNLALITLSIIAAVAG